MGNSLKDIKPEVKEIHYKQKMRIYKLQCDSENHENISKSLKKLYNI